MHDQVTQNVLNQSTIPGGIFLIREDEGRSGPVLTAHSFSPVEGERKVLLDRAFADAGVRRSRVQVHRAKALRSAGSLAAIDRRFAGGPIVYDPTAMFRRTSEVVRCASMIRTALGRKAESVLMDTTRRTLYVVLNEKAFHGQGLTFRAETAEAMALVARTFRAWKKDAPADFEFAVRVGYAAPADAHVVAVDDKSRPSTQLAALGNFVSRFRKTASAVAVGALAAGASTAAYAQTTGGDPTAAVSTPNATIIGQGWFHSGLLTGNVKDDAADGGAVVDLPIFHSFGVQGEGGAGTDGYRGGAGQLFWRDPNWGLIGGLYSHESLGDATMNRYAGEAEVYLDCVTLSGRGGYQEGTVEHGGWGRFDVGFYATQNFVARAGFEDRPEAKFGRAGFEWQPAANAWSGLSVFIDGNFGEHISGAKFGFKFHFGEEGGETLIYRDRHEDPLLAIFNDLPLVHKTHYVAAH